MPNTHRRNESQQVFHFFFGKAHRPAFPQEDLLVLHQQRHGQVEVKLALKHPVDHPSRSPRPAAERRHPDVGVDH